MSMLISYSVCSLNIGLRLSHYTSLQAYIQIHSVVRLFALAFTFDCIRLVILNIRSQDPTRCGRLTFVEKESLDKP